jgi:hypothetical protein
MERRRWTVSAEPSVRQVNWGGTDIYVFPHYCTSSPCPLGISSGGSMDLMGSKQIRRAAIVDHWKYWYLSQQRVRGAYPFTATNTHT